MIHYTFDQPALLERALTHGSVSDEDMERLEFLGDAVLELVITQYLHDHFPNNNEGQLTRMRAVLVCKEGLLRVAGSWHLDDILHVGAGERRADGGIKSSSIMSNAVEAVVGAIFQDGGFKAAQTVILKAWKDMLEGISTANICDAKSRLQEYTQSKSWGLPEYEVHDLGANKKPRFNAVCRVQKKQLGEGMGNRKKTAELAAADMAWKYIQHNSEALNV